MTLLTLASHPHAYLQSRTSRLTYLDTSFSGGRPVIVLRKVNAVAEHIVPMTVSYTFPKTAILLEPFYLVLAFLAFYVICMVAVRLDLRIGGGGSGSGSSASVEKKKQ